MIVENIDTEAFALGSYYCPVACIFQSIDLRSANFPTIGRTYRVTDYTHAHIR